MTTPPFDSGRPGRQPDQNQEPPEPGMVQIPRRNLLLVGVLILVMAVGLGYLVSKLSDKNASNQSIFASDTPSSASSNSKTTAYPNSAVALNAQNASPAIDHIIKVYVTGEVQNPGVYQMKAGDRLVDAIELAGGFNPLADKSGLDLAQRVRDEMEINVPKSNAIALPVGTAGAVATPGLIILPPTVTPAAGTASLINVNTASAVELDKLPGIGATLSQRIVDYRTKNGPFKNMDDLRKVAGITKSVIEKIKDLISF